MGVVSGGIPSKKTTEESTQMVANDGQAVLIAGLIKTASNSRQFGIPVLARYSGAGPVALEQGDIGSTSGTIVVITPRIVPLSQSTLAPVSERTLSETVADPILPPNTEPAPLR